MEDTILYKTVRVVISFFIKVFIRPQIVQKENIPKEGRIILAGTHTSILDCLLLMSSTKRSIHFLAKKELWKGPKKIIFSHMGLIPVDRSKKDKSVIPMAVKTLEKEKIIGIFPEGTTEKGRGLLPFKMGTVKIAKEANTQIVPFVIKGKYKLFSKDLKIVFGKAYSIKDNNLEKENIKLENKIKEMLKD